MVRGFKKCSYLISLLLQWWKTMQHLKNVISEVNAKLPWLWVTWIEPHLLFCCANAHPYNENKTKPSLLQELRRFIFSPFSIPSQTPAPFICLMWVCDSSEQYNSDNNSNTTDNNSNSDNNNNSKNINSSSKNKSNNITQKSSKMKQETWKLKKMGLKSKNSQELENWTRSYKQNSSIEFDQTEKQKLVTLLTWLIWSVNSSIESNSTLEFEQSKNDLKAT